MMKLIAKFKTTKLVTTIIAIALKMSSKYSLQKRAALLQVIKISSLSHLI